jgi:uncharacterized membrane protein
MLTWYNLFKFLHVVAVIVWVGGVITLAIVNARLARERDGAAAQALARHSAFFGQRVVGPSVGLTLLAGIAMLAVNGWTVPFWVQWGFVAIVAAAILGGGVLQRAGRRVAELAAAPSPDPTHLTAARRKVATLGWVLIALLLSTVWVMVFKPTL